MLKNYNDGSVTNSKLYLHGQNDYPLLEKDKTSAAAENLALYVYGLNGAIAKRVGSTVLFLLKDHLGSTRVVMDATGLVRTYYDYDALGNLIRTGTTNEVTYQFTGQEFDESGLHNYRARMYDSDLGKFYAVDPAGQGWSPFAYAGNNFIIVVDRDGRAFFLAPILIGAAVGAIWSGATYAITPGVEGFKWGGFFSAAGIGALGGALGGAASLIAPAGIISGALYGAGTGGVIGGLTSELAGGDFWSGFVPGAIGGAIGGGLGGYQKAKASGRNIWTGAKPRPNHVEIPMVVLNKMEIRVGEGYKQQLREIPFESADPASDIRIGPGRTPTEGVRMAQNIRGMAAMEVDELRNAIYGLGESIEGVKAFGSRAGSTFRSAHAVNPDLDIVVITKDPAGLRQPLEQIGVHYSQKFQIPLHIQAMDLRTFVNTFRPRMLNTPFVDLW